MIELLKPSNFTPIELKVTIENEEQLKVWYELGNTSSAKTTDFLNVGLTENRKVNVDVVSDCFSPLFSILSGKIKF